MANYIISTASNTMCYPIYSEGKQNSAVPVKKIFVKGMANVANPVSLQMTDCAWTEISDQDLADLKKSAAFNRHVAKGFLRVMTTKDETVKKSMTARDGSAQLRDEEYAEGKDPRVLESGNCQASCGRNDRIKGKKGANFISE